MYDTLNKEECLDEIRRKVCESSELMRSDIPNVNELIETLSLEIRELWFRIYDIDGKPYIRD